MWELWLSFQTFLLLFSLGHGTLQSRCGTFAMVTISGPFQIIVQMFTVLLCIRADLSCSRHAHETLQSEHLRLMALFNLSKLTFWPPSSMTRVNLGWLTLLRTPLQLKERSNSAVSVPTNLSLGRRVINFKMNSIKCWPSTNSLIFLTANRSSQIL